MLQLSLDYCLYLLAEMSFHTMHPASRLVTATIDIHDDTTAVLIGEHQNRAQLIAIARLEQRPLLLGLFTIGSASKTTFSEHECPTINLSSEQHMGYMRWCPFIKQRGLRVGI